MKKFIAGALTATITALNVCAADVKLDAEAVFDSAESILSISGNAEIGENINMTVQPYEIESDKLTEEEANSTKAVFNMTTADKNGCYFVSMGLPEVWSEGVYKVLVYQGDNVAESWFTYIGISDDELGKINSSDASGLKSMLSSIGINKELDDKYGTKISTILVNIRPESGYTKDEFLKELTAALGICMIKSGDLNVEELIERFSNPLGVDNDEFESYTSDIKNETARLIKQLDINKTSAEFFAECLMLARVNKAESVESLQKLIIDNSGVFGINLSGYNAISTDYQKAQVFQGMIGKSFADFASVKKCFEESLPAAGNVTSRPSGGGGSTGGGGSSGGGSYGGAYSTDAPVTQAVFADIKGHWAEEAVKNLTQKNILNGFPDGSFKPEQSVTRAEFSKMICVAKNIYGSSSGVGFADVAESDWYSTYVKALSASNIVNGFADGTFRPNDKISRQDAAVIVWRIINSESDSRLTFSDEAEVADYAKEAVAKLGGLGIINGYNGYFNPSDNITRAEAAKILNSILNLG